MYDELQFEKLDVIENTIRSRCTEITHITVHEIVDRNSYPQLGRICFSATDLGAFIEADEDGDHEPSDDGDDECDEDDDTDDDSGSDSDDLGDLARTDGGVTYARLSDAAMCWIRHLASQNMIGEKEGRFKVNLWKGKGDKVIHSARFACTNPDFEEPAVAAIVAPPLPVSFPDNAPEARTWRALGEGYTHLIALLQSSYAHLANLQNSHISNQSGQVGRAQKSIEQVVTQLTNLKIGAFEAESGSRTDDGQSRVREELGKEFIAQLGTFGRVVASAKFGMAPEMVELAEIVNASPELMEAMKNPEVRKILRDEKTRKELAALLLMAAQAGSTPANDPTPPAGDKAAA